MRRIRKRIDRDTIEQEALERALANNSTANYPAIIAGFVAKGIAAGEIVPRENVFTYHAWRRKGRQVMRGEHGVKINTVIEVEKTVDQATGATELVKKRKSASVFHVSQTKELGGEDPAGHVPLPDTSPTPTNSNGNGKPRVANRERGETSEEARERIVDRLRTLADGLDKHIKNALRPMTQRHTPKRYAQYTSRVHDGYNIRRTQKALRVLADLWEAQECPQELARYRSKADISMMVAKGCESCPNGYHPYTVTGEDYLDDSPQARLLQGLIERDETPERRAMRTRDEEIQQREAELRGCTIEGFFPTPPDLAREIVELARIEPAHEVLEPSAGIGSLAEIVREECPEAELVCIERVARLCDVLRLKGFTTHEADFFDVGGEVDRIVMNPPFERGQDIQHVRHAWDLLRPGGRLVAIMSPGPFFRKDRQSTEFREWLIHETSMTRYEELENQFNKCDAFRTTGVRIAVVVLIKPTHTP